MKLNAIFFALSAFAASANGASLVEVLNANGFSQFAQELQSHPELLTKFTARNDVTIYAPVNKPVYPHGHTRRVVIPPLARLSVQASHTGNPPSAEGLDRKRSASNFVTVRTFLDDPTLVNLGPSQPFRIVSNYDSKPGSSAASIEITSGGGQSNSQVSGPFKYDEGIIVGVNDFFAAPQPFTETIEAAGLTTFSNSIKSSNLEALISSRAGVTIFAPVNSDKWDGTINVLEHSITTRFLFSPQLIDYAQLTSDLGTPLTITSKGGSLYVNDVKIVQPNISTNNGVVHAIERPLTSTLPPTTPAKHHPRIRGREVV